MTAKYLLGIDIGTYSSKGVLIQTSSEVVATHVVEHPLEIPRPGWAEHDAETTWWHDFLEITRALLATSGVDPRQIAGAGFSAISPAVLPIDRQGRPLRKAILYGIDTRATQEIAELQQIIDGDAELRKMGIKLSSQAASPRSCGCNATNRKCGKRHTKSPTAVVSLFTAWQVKTLSTFTMPSPSPRSWIWSRVFIGLRWSVTSPPSKKCRA